MKDFELAAIRATSATTTRTLADRLKDTGKSVLDYGAVADGVTNNKVAFTNAISGGGKIIIPPVGTYWFDEGVNLDDFSDNLEFSIDGGGAVLAANMDDFIFRKVLRGGGDNRACREIRNVKFVNSATSAGTTFTVSTATWSATGYRGITGVTITLTAPHGITVGESRFMEIAGISPAGYIPDSEGFAGVLITSATQFTYYMLSNPGAYVSGGTCQLYGGGLAFGAGYWGGGVYNCQFTGLVGALAWVDSPTKWFQCDFAQSGKVGKGLYIAGHCVADGCNFTGWGAGLAGNAGGNHGVTLIGCRFEINGAGLVLFGSTGWTVSGTYFEANDRAVVMSGSSYITFQDTQIHMSSGDTAIDITGACTRIKFQNVTAYGTLTGSLVEFANSLTGTVAIRFDGCNFDNQTDGSKIITFPVGQTCPQYQSTDGVQASGYSSTFANRPTYTQTGDAWQITDSSQPPGSTTAIAAAGGGTAYNVMARKSSDGNWYAYCKAA